jgi:hypothetical protein
VGVKAMNNSIEGIKTYGNRNIFFDIGFSVSIGVVTSLLTYIVKGDILFSAAIFVTVFSILIAIGGMANLWE